MIAQGEAVVRDGIYSTDENMKFLLQGAYFFQQGTLLLLAHPTKYDNRNKERSVKKEDKERIYMG